MELMEQCKERRVAILLFNCYNEYKGRRERKKEMESAKEKGKVENRTIEQLLKDLREEKGWTYLQVVEKLQELGLSMDDKKVKKWEIGLEYPL